MSPSSESATEQTERPGDFAVQSPSAPVCKACGRRNAEGAQRCSTCQCVLPGNQVRRKYPKPALDDPRVQQQLAGRRDEIIEQRGGRQRLSPMQIGEIERFAVLEMFVSSWETYFMKSSPISRQGRVRSGYREGYLASLSMLMKLGASIGVSRVAHDIGDLSAAEYAALDAVQTSAITTTDEGGS